MNGLRALIEVLPVVIPRRKLDGGERCTLWEKYCGEIYNGHCFCCNKANITPFNFHCGHVEAHSNGGSDTLDNFRPLCVNCNLSMRAQNMEQYMKMKYPEQYKVKFGSG